ncbi:hypothetical protein [Staphylococcus hominis]
MDFTKIIIPNDLTRFNKSDLDDLATELDMLSDIDNKSELAVEIYKQFKQKQDLSDNFKEIINNKLLAGRTATKWFKSEDELKFEEVLEALSSNNRNAINDIDTSKVGYNENLMTSPSIFAIIFDKEQEQMFIRFVYKNGIRHEVNGTNISKRLIPAYSTLYIDFKKQLIEYRGDAKKSKKTISSFIRNINKTNSNFEAKEKFSFSVENVADKLSGELIDTISLPDANVKIDNKKLKGITEVLEAIDGYFENKNIEKLGTALQDINELFDNNIDNNIMPFSSLLLSGLETVGLGSNKELRDTPLYKYLNTNLTQTTGFIRIQVTENNVVNDYTIRVGIQTKSIYFTSDVNENVIKYVRDNLFN